MTDKRRRGRPRKTEDDIKAPAKEAPEETPKETQEDATVTPSPVFWGSLVPAWKYATVSTVKADILTLAGAEDAGETLLQFHRNAPDTLRGVLVDAMNSIIIDIYRSADCPHARVILDAADAISPQFFPYLEYARAAVDRREGVSE